LKFYQEALGLKETNRKNFPEAEFTLVYLADEDKNYELELTYNYNPEKPYELGDGYWHMAFSVEDLEATHQEQKDSGYEVTELMGLPGNKPDYYFLTDPDGYQIEIIREK